MAYKGKYRPIHPKKYKGDPTNIVYRSLWERKFMVYCDLSESVIEWSSEEIVIWYRSPVDGRPHRYFPDFLVKVKESNGSTKKMMIEIKPKKQCALPKKPKRQTKKYLYEAYEYAKNQAKWEAAKEFCKDRNWVFKVFTEDDLGIGNE